MFFLINLVAPVCRPGQQKSYGIARQERARIPCELEANPVSGLSFTWKFNNSAEALDIPASHIFSDGANSHALYIPMTEADYGTLLCWGHNDIGAQKEPCVYYINPAGNDFSRLFQLGVTPTGKICYIVHATILSRIYHLLIV